jgi:hypothetical protein
MGDKGVVVRHGVEVSKSSAEEFSFVGYIRP